MTQSHNSKYYEEPLILSGLLEIPDLVDEPKSIWQSFQQASSLFGLDSFLAENKQAPLPELHPEFFALDRNEEVLLQLDFFVASTSPSEISGTASTDDPVQDDGILQDIWSFKDVVSGDRKTHLVNWDTFLRPQADTPRSAYLSEAGSVCLDAVLAIQASHTNKGLPKVTAQHDDVLRSLLELGSGRNSLLYRYDKDLAQFVPFTADFGLSGVSFQAKQNVVQDVLHLGNCIRQLEAFLAMPQCRPLSIALKSVTSIVLYAVATTLQTSKPKIRSILQLTEAFCRPSRVLQTLQNLVTIAAKGDCASETILKLMHESEEVDSRHPWLAQLFHEILARVAAPWISAVEVDIGFRQCRRTIEHNETDLSGDIEAQAQISHSNPETPMTIIEELVAEPRRCLDILRDQQADHPLLDPSSNLQPRISWKMSWEDISRIQTQADEYEQNLRSAILRYTRGDWTKVSQPRHDRADDILSREEEDPILTNLDATNVLGQDLGGRLSHSESLLFQLTSVSLETKIAIAESFAPSELCPPLPQSLLLSLTPSINAQSRLLSFSIFHNLFKRHSLLSHLTLQHRFQLLCDGHFASRLSHALFDPDQSTGEGRRTSEGTTGLRLQARDTWPPASSELRLVLMGILNDSYHSPLHSNGRDSGELPGNLSFAIRNLSAEELEKCRDVSNVEALDFLKLHYQTPPLLDSVITRSSLKMYDRIFRYRLRLLRIQAVAQSLVRDVAGRNAKVDKPTQRFRRDIQHVVSTLAAYSTNDVIDMEWSRFQVILKEIEAGIDRGDYEGTIATAGSLSRLEKLHDEVLGRISKALFLDRRQAQGKEVIESIFRLILRFASSGRRNQDEMEIEDKKEMHGEFKVQVGRLVRYLRSQAAASTAESALSEDYGLLSNSEPPFEHLLVKLDMFGYFT